MTKHVGLGDQIVNQLREQIEKDREYELAALEDALFDMLRAYEAMLDHTAQAVEELKGTHFSIQQMGAAMLTPLTMRRAAARHIAAALIAKRDQRLTTKGGDPIFWP